ncbi:MAG: gluconate 2-dehydrogenase subunit 3 family protein [Archangium sp.]
MKMYLPPKGEPPRRGFLKKGLFGGLVLALGGGGWLFTRKGAEVTLPAGVANLTAAEYAVVNALVNRFAPKGGQFPSADALQTALAVDRIFGMVEESTRAELKQLLMLFENALPNFLFGGRTAAFSTLTGEEQDEVLAEWMNSRLTVRRTGYNALRGLVLAAYFGNKQTWAAVGYGGPIPGIHDPNAVEYRGGEQERPLGNGIFIEPEAPAPAPEAPKEGAP